jgi:hypothetical protein
MTLTINYRHNDSAEYPIRAVIELPNGELAVGIGKTGEDAKASALEQAQLKLVPLPPSEEVDFPQ